jgi:hypothetical protein
MFSPVPTLVPPNFITIFSCFQLFFYVSSLVANLCLMSKRSLKTALAVSMPPAPLPIRVCSAANSHWKVTAFRTPLTQSGLVLGISVGFTVVFSPSREPMSFMVLPVLLLHQAFLEVTSRMPVRSTSFRVIFLFIIQLAKNDHFAGGVKTVNIHGWLSLRVAEFLGVC